MHLMNLSELNRIIADMKNDRRMLDALGGVGGRQLPAKVSLSVQSHDPKLGGAGHLVITGTTRDALCEILQRQLEANEHRLKSMGMEWYGDKPEESAK